MLDTSRCHAISFTVNLFYFECAYFTVHPLTMRLLLCGFGAPMIISLRHYRHARSRRQASRRFSTCTYQIYLHLYRVYLVQVLTAVYCIGSAPQLDRFCRIVPVRALLRRRKKRRLTIYSHCVVMNKDRHIKGTEDTQNDGSWP